MSDHREAPAPTLGEPCRFCEGSAEVLQIMGELTDMQRGRIASLEAELAAERAEGSEENEDDVPMSEEELAAVWEALPPVEPRPRHRLVHHPDCFCRAERAEPDGALFTEDDADMLHAAADQAYHGEPFSEQDCDHLRSIADRILSVLASAPQRAGTEGEKGERTP